MSIPDQSHINRVRDALWQRSGGGASVMVGSGFSRNALKTRPAANGPPTWRELAEAVYDKLYPQPQDENRDLGTATSDFLRLAQEYEAKFGQGDLHRFLIELIRDDDFLPGDFHIRLLSLPWHDIFTTNWDTLLERARTSVAGRAYSVVRNMAEIPLANRPRIVKLHGSAPSHFPLIFTQEDYRTYSTKFAPFVNTMRQAMMETVFCLIGFSGDDPNFLQWSGWVRDNLGDAAPKIYLAGWLDLSSPGRRMIEGLNVVPIDLASHPKADEWPEHLRHQYATEWILHTLERGELYDVTAWPSPQKHAALPTHLEPVEVVKSNTPQEEPYSPSELSEPENVPGSVRQLLGIWEHNRKIYPGWLTVPSSERQLLSLYTNEWEQKILQVLPDFAPIERLNAIRELVWRKEILLEPILSQLESAAAETLKPIDCHRRTIDGVVNRAIEWAAVREAWRTVALTLVTAARRNLDQHVFEQRIEALSPFRQDDPDVDQRIRHERCLWAMYSIDFEALDGLLKDWQTENCDPVWMMRKAALLAETGRNDEASGLIEYTLAASRESPANDRSVVGPSCESWALWSAWRDGGENRQELMKRWNKLAPLKCNALTEKHHIANAIKSKRETEEAPVFDLGGRQGSGFSLSSEEFERQIAAYRAIRLSEVAGLPPSINHVNVATDILKLAAESLVVLYPEMAARLVLRVSTEEGDKTLKRVFSRTRVAVLSVDSAKALAEICSSVIEYALPQMVGMTARGNYPLFWIGRMRVAMEVLSRLVLRLDPDMVESIFTKALEYYQNDYVARDSWLGYPLRNLLKRSWETLLEDRRIARVLDLLNAPIIGMDNFTAKSAAHYRDPGELLQDDELFSPPRTADNECHWQEVVSLLVRGLHAGGEARKRASLRIVLVELEKQLTEAELSQVAQALWDKRYTGPDELPGETSLLDGAFLLLPEPEFGLAEQRFRRKWLTASNAPQKDAPSHDDILWQVGNAISYLKNHQRPLELSEDERAYLIKVVEQWSDTPVPSHYFGPIESQLREPTLRALSGLHTVISEIQIPVPIGEKLYGKAQDLNESGIPGFGLMAGLVKSLPNRFDELALMMRMGLLADSVDLAEGAAKGLYHWLNTSAEADSQIQPPSDDLVREIGVVIATRKKTVLAQALQIAKWVFDEGNDVQKETLRDLALQGLGSLVEELRYDREHDLDFDVPLLRCRCAHLALSMAERGFNDAPTVTRWLEISKEDPLPEVRHAKHSSLARQRKEEEGTDDAPTSQAEHHVQHDQQAGDHERPSESQGTLADFLQGHIGILHSSEHVPGGARMSVDSSKKFAAGLLKQRQQEER